MRWIALCALVPIVLGAVPKCEKTVITQQRTIEAQGLKINFTISECAGADKKHFKPLTDAEVRDDSGAEKRSSALDASFKFAKRQSSKCRLPAPHCICDIPCTDLQCSGSRSNITSTDCSQLSRVLSQTGAQLDGTFLIEPGQTAAVTYNACTYSVFNNEASNVQEYCYSSFAKAANDLGFNCSYLFVIFDIVKEGFCSGGTVNGVPRFLVEQFNSAFTGAPL